jgi:hypothetical protein
MQIESICNVLKNKIGVTPKYYSILKTYGVQPGAAINQLNMNFLSEFIKVVDVIKVTAMS